MSAIMVYVVTKDKKQAKTIGMAAVKSRLAACANILPPIESIYHWDGKIQQDKEVVLIIKTQQKHFAALKKLVLKLHSYDCPCIVSWPIKNSHAAYLKWLASETK